MAIIMHWIRYGYECLYALPTSCTASLFISCFWMICARFGFSRCAATFQQAMIDHHQSWLYPESLYPAGLTSYASPPGFRRCNRQPDDPHPPSSSFGQAPTCHADHIALRDNTYILSLLTLIRARCTVNRSPLPATTRPYEAGNDRLPVQARKASCLTAA